MNLLTPFSLLALAAGLSAQSDLRVPAQFPTISSAIAAAVNGDRILIAPGNYNESGLVVNGKAIEIRSTDGAAATTIDGGGAGTVFELIDVPSPGVVVRGLRITGGSSSGGGGILVEASPFTGTRTFAEIEDCVFDQNAAPSGSGGGVSIEANTEVVVRGCLFLANSASSGSGGGVAVNGAFFGLDPAPFALIESCRFINNSASSGSGAGLSASDEATVVVRDCMFRDNSTPSGGGSALSAEAFGQPGVNLSVFGCTMAGNNQTAVSIGDDVDARFRDTLIWGNANTTQLGASVFLGATTIDLEFCNIQGPVPSTSGSLTVTQTSVTSVDPLFSAPAAGDYTLQSTSPMIDAGAPGTLVTGRDAFGDPRLFDGDSDGFFRTDIGADEFAILRAELSDPGIAGGGTTTLTIVPDPGFQLIAATIVGSPRRDDFFLGGIGQVFVSPTLLLEAFVSGTSRNFTNPGVSSSFGLRLQAVGLLAPLNGGAPVARLSNPVDLFLIQ